MNRKSVNRKLLDGAAAAFLSVLVAGTAQAADYGQLAGSARIGAAESASMTLDEIVARKFSQEGRDNRQAARGFAPATTVRSSRTAGGESLDSVHLRMVNRGVSGEERQAVVDRREFAADPAARRQLAASASIDAADAAELSLQAIAGYKFNREADGDDKAPVRR